MSWFMTQKMVDNGRGFTNTGGLFIRKEHISCFSYDDEAKLCRIHMISGETHLVGHSVSEVMEEMCYDKPKNEDYDEDDFYNRGIITNDDEDDNRDWDKDYDYCP
jgi:hypothetical protein